MAGRERVRALKRLHGNARTGMRVRSLCGLLETKNKVRGTWTRWIQWLFSGLLPALNSRVKIDAASWATAQLIVGQLSNFDYLNKLPRDITRISRNFNVT
jgi:hypothetical protein